MNRLIAVLAAFLATSAMAQFDGLEATPTSGGSPFVTASSLATQGPVTLYVDPAGNDSNACTSSGSSACLTPDGARQKLPYNINDPVTINLACGGFDAGMYLNDINFGIGARYPANDAGAFLKVVGCYTDAGVTLTTGTWTGTVSASTQAGRGFLTGSTIPSTWGTATLSGGNYTVNQLTGVLLAFTTGPAAGTKALISTNTATVATIVGAFDVMPNNGDTYQLLLPGTTINGVLPRPSAAQNASLSTTSSAAFYLANNKAGAYMGGTASFQSEGLAVYGNANWADPPISIEGIKYALGSINHDAVSIGAGSNAVVRWSRVDDGNTNDMVSLGDNAMAQIEGNFFNGANQLLEAHGPLLRYGAGAFSYVHGNIAGGSNNSVLALLGGGSHYIIQNQWTGTAAGSPGLLWMLDANIVSSGNTWSSTAEACVSALDKFTTRFGTSKAFVMIDGDTFTNCLFGVWVTRGSRIFFNRDPPLGSGNGTGVLVKNGGYAEYASNATSSMTSTTADLSIDGVNYSLTTLRATAPKSISVTASGSTVYEN